MSWVRVDDKSTWHKKVVKAGNAAWGALVRMLAHCKDLGTDGNVSGEVARAIGSSDEIARLLDVGLLESNGEDFIVHDFLEWNESAKQAEKTRKARSKAGQASAQQRANKRSNTCSNSSSTKGVGVGDGSGVSDLEGVQGEGETATSTVEPELSTHERYARAYVEGQDRAGAGGYPALSERHHGDLAQLALALRPKRGEAEAKIRETSEAFRRARPGAGQFTRGWDPRACIDWLRAGRPSDVEPPSGVRPRQTLLLDRRTRQLPAAPGERQWQSAEEG